MLSYRSTSALTAVLHPTPCVEKHRFGQCLPSDGTQVRRVPDDAFKLRQPKYCE